MTRWWRFGAASLVPVAALALPEARYSCSFRSSTSCWEASSLELKSAREGPAHYDLRGETIGVGGT